MKRYVGMLSVMGMINSIPSLCLSLVIGFLLFMNGLDLKLFGTGLLYIVGYIVFSVCVMALYELVTYIPKKHQIVVVLGGALLVFCILYMVFDNPLVACVSVLMALNILGIKPMYAHAITKGNHTLWFLGTSPITIFLACTLMGSLNHLIALWIVN